MANTPNYAINYDDERLVEAKADTEQKLTENEQLYGGMISESDKYYQAQIDASKQWAGTQSQLQQEQTDFTIEQINQQKDQAKKDYLKEQSGAYVDWQKQSNQYGTEAEKIASQGLTGTGFSESSQVGMYNTYQNRVASARESYSQAVLNYDNAIKDARLQNNSILAEIAYEALQSQLELSLQGFQYKNNLILEQANKKLEIENLGWQKQLDIISQMNTENQFAESIRQYEQDFAEQQRQFEAQLQHDFEMLEKEHQNQLVIIDKEHAQAKERIEIEYQNSLKLLKEEDKLERQRAEEEHKRQLELLEKETAEKKKLLAQELANEKAMLKYEYDLKKANVTGGGGSNYKVTSIPTAPKKAVIKQDLPETKPKSKSSSSNFDFNSVANVYGTGIISETQIAKDAANGKVKIVSKNGKLYVYKNTNLKTNGTIPSLLNKGKKYSTGAGGLGATALAKLKREFR